MMAQKEVRNLLLETGGRGILVMYCKNLSNTVICARVENRRKCQKNLVIELRFPRKVLKVLPTIFLLLIIKCKIENLGIGLVIRKGPEVEGFDNILLPRVKKKKK